MNSSSNKTGFPGLSACLRDSVETNLSLTFHPGAEYPSFRPSTHVSVYLMMYHFIHLSIHLSITPLIPPSICPSICLSIYSSIHSFRHFLSLFHVPVYQVLGMWRWVRSYLAFKEFQAQASRPLSHANSHSYSSSVVLPGIIFVFYLFPCIVGIYMQIFRIIPGLELGNKLLPKMIQCIPLPLRV